MNSHYNVSAVRGRHGRQKISLSESTVSVSVVSYQCYILVPGLVAAMFALLLRLTVSKMILFCISLVIIISQSVRLAVPVIWINLWLCPCMFFYSRAPSITELLNC